MHVQGLLPEIKAILTEGKIQREIAEHFGFRDKQIVKELLNCERRKERKLEGRDSSQAYFKQTQQYGITLSMSRHGNPYDNAMAEIFFSILKNRVHLSPQTDNLLRSKRSG